MCPMPCKDDTFVTGLFSASRNFPDTEALVTCDGHMNRKSITFKELFTLASKYAYILRRAGLKRGDYVVVTFPMSIEFWIVSVGVLLAGGIHMSMAKIFQGAGMINQLFTDSKAKFIILRKEPKDTVWQLFKDHVQESKNDQYLGVVKREETPLLKTAFFVQRTSEKGTLGLMDRLEQATSSYIDTTLEPTDGACVPLSATANGRLKMVEISHKSLVAYGNAMVKELPGQKTYMPFNWYLSVGIPYDNLTGHTRFTLDLWEQIDDPTEITIKFIKKEEIRQIFSMPIEIAEVKMKGGTDLVDYAIATGQPFNRGLFDKISGVGQQLGVMYSSSECLIISVNKTKLGDDFSAFDSGAPFEGVEIRILSEHNLSDLPAGETGRIAVRSPWLMTKYVGDPENSKSVWLKDGWFLSDDLGCMGPDGHMLVYGRAGDVISRGIILLSPGWLEKPISAHPDVTQVTVVPVPDVDNMYNTCACVVKKSGSTLTEKDIIGLVRESVSELFKEQIVLDHAVFFENCLPQGSRTELGEIAAAKLGLKK